MGKECQKRKSLYGMTKGKGKVEQDHLVEWKIELELRRQARGRVKEEGGWRELRGAQIRRLHWKM